MYVRELLLQPPLKCEQTFPVLGQSTIVCHKCVGVQVSSLTPHLPSWIYRGSACFSVDGCVSAMQKYKLEGHCTECVPE